MSKPYKLITIKVSNFNEKARFTLAFYDLPYVEKGYLPLFHFIPVMLATRGQGKADRTSSKFSTPVLITPEKACLTHSSQIMAYLSSRYSTQENDLFYDAGVRRWVEYFDNKMGVEARRLAYYYLIERKDLVRKMAFNNVGKIQAQLYVFFQFLIKPFFKKVFHLTPERAEQSKATLRQLFQEMGEKLKEGKGYLLGDKVSAADITFACHAAPVLLIQKEEGYGAWLPPIAKIPDEFAVFAKELRQTEAGQFALKVFKKHKLKIC